LCVGRSVETWHVLQRACDALGYLILAARDQAPG